MRQVRIHAERLNAPPELPDVSRDFIDLIGIQNTRVGEIILNAQQPQLSADGRQLLYVVGLQADYAMARPPRVNERIAIGAPPYRQVSGNDASRALPPSIFLPPQRLLS